MRFVDAVRRSAQDPFGASMLFLDSLGALYGAESGAYVFSAFAHGDDERHPDFRQALFRDEPYSEGERAEYEALSEDDKLAVLGFETVLLHELTHQIDTLITPLAAWLHMWQAQEFSRLLPVLRCFAEHPELDISAPLARSASQEGHPVREALRRYGHLDAVEELLDHTAGLRSLDGIAAADLSPGWDGERGYLNFFGQPLEAVTAFGVTRTARRLNTPRPLTLRTVLETHALSNCLSHLLWRFRDDPAVGAREMARYLRHFYPPGTEDYTFVLDAISGSLGFGDFAGALGQLAGTGVSSLDQLPVLAGLLAWAALHSSQPTERMVYAADYLHTSITNGVRFDSPTDILRRLDQEINRLPMATDALELGLQLSREQRLVVPADPVLLAGHFSSVLATVERELARRIERGHGLADPVGFPNRGNPARYLNAEQANSFGGKYRTDPAYQDWRKLRTLVLARRQPSARKHAAIAAWLADLS